MEKQKVIRLSVPASVVVQKWSHHPDFFLVHYVYSRLAALGYRTLLAGGCVRDLILGRNPVDFDIATSATPDQVQALFPRTLELGKQFGIIEIIHHHQGDGGFTSVQVATFRQDGGYQDGRRPKFVEFSDEFQDAQRRDFRINGLFFDLYRGEVLDYVGGIQDLQSKCLDCIGDPRQRFEEDHLRLLRALRFAVQTGFSMELKTMEAIKEGALKIQRVSVERIHYELTRILEDPFWLRGVKLMEDLGLWKALVPGWGGDGGTLPNSKISFASATWAASSLPPGLLDSVEDRWVFLWVFWIGGGHLFPLPGSFSSSSSFLKGGLWRYMGYTRKENKWILSGLFWALHPEVIQRESLGSLIERCFDPSSWKGLRIYTLLALERAERLEGPKKLERIQERLEFFGYKKPPLPEEGRHQLKGGAESIGKVKEMYWNYLEGREGG